MAGAWNVLDKLYGDKDLVANKLKVQLKNIKPKGRNDHDVIIDLVTEVNNISLRLKTLNMDQILQVDSEFLSAVFRVLPSNSQLEWLKFDKSTFNTKWDGLMQFLDTARDQALQTKVLLSTYQGSESDDKAVECKKCGSSEHKIKRCPLIKANAVSAVGDDSEDRAKKKLMKKQKEECGKCPLCSQYHTFTKWQNREEWPTDRMFKCEKFQKLSLNDRAAALESHKVCAKCTSWNHQKTSCKSFRKCGNMVNGVKCDGEHSTLVCGSGSAYCGSVRVSTLSSSTESLSSISSATSSSGSNSLDSSSDSLSSSSSASSDGTFPDVNAETALLFQDVKVLGAGEARSC